MIYVVTAVGVLMCAAGLVGLAAPSLLAGAVSRVARSRSMRRVAIGLRIVFGAIAIIVSEQTLYPWPVKIIGIIAIMGGTITAVAGGEAVSRWVENLGRNSAAMRALSAVSLALGAFLIHASL